MRGIDGQAKPAPCCCGFAAVETEVPLAGSLVCGDVVSRPIVTSLSSSDAAVAPQLTARPESGPRHRGSSSRTWAGSRSSSSWRSRSDTSATAAAQT